MTRETQVQVELQVRVTFDSDSALLKSILGSLRRTGGRLKSHVLYRFGEQSVALFLCENPAEAALALKQARLAVDTETVVTLLTEERPGMLEHLTETLAAEGIAVGYSHSTVTAGRFFAVLRTDNNPKAEDLLRRFIVLPESC